MRVVGPASGPGALLSRAGSAVRLEITAMTNSRRLSLSARALARVAVAGVVAVGAPLALVGTAEAASPSIWDRLARCESGGDWNANTGNGYYGGLQFSHRTWRAFGGSGHADDANRTEQISVAERVLDTQGWRAWPACSRKLGLR